MIESRQVDWWSVNEFVAPVLDQAGGWPLAGSPAWQQLADDDPRKLAAVLDGARRDALRNDTTGMLLAEASKAVAAAADWPATARRIFSRPASYIPREVA